MRSLPVRVPAEQIRGRFGASCHGFESRFDYPGVSGMSSHCEARQYADMCLFENQVLVQAGSSLRGSRCVRPPRITSIWQSRSHETAFARGEARLPYYHLV